LNPKAAPPFFFLFIMTKVLLAFLVAFAMLFQAQAYGSRSGRNKLAENLREAANEPAATRNVQATTGLQQASAVNQLAFEPGSLRLLNGRRLQVPGLRYHASQYLVEIQDSLQPDSTHFLSLRDLRGFDMGDDDQLPAPAAVLNGPVGPAGPRRFRAHLVQGSRWSTRSETLEILTCTEAGALVLAVLPTSTAPRQAFVGSGTSRTEPMHPLELTRDAVLSLFGNRAAQVRAFAMTYDLHFEQAADVARMFDHYNHLVVVQE
jgi:hypothetical protein